MPGKVAVILYERCHPEQCDSGKCKAAMACTRKLLKQEAPNEPPMAHPSLCRACGDCVRACPNAAIKIVSM